MAAIPIECRYGVVMYPWWCPTCTRRDAALHIRVDVPYQRRHALDTDDCYRCYCRMSPVTDLMAASYRLGGWSALEDYALKELL